MEDKQREQKMKNSKKRMMFALIFPKKKAVLHIEQQTQEYIHKVKEEIGLLDILPTWNNAFLSVEYRYPLFWNPTCEGHAHVGRKGDRWIAQVSLLSEGIQHDIVRYIFSRLPDADDVLIANVLNQIDMYYRSHENKSSLVDCHVCNTPFHWINTGGTIQDKWVSFQEKHCGCE